jgi:hypothetical protein
MAKMTLKQWILKHKEELTNRIFRLHNDLRGKIKSVNWQEIRTMVKNEPTLKEMAEADGITVGK